LSLVAVGLGAGGKGGQRTDQALPTSFTHSKRRRRRRVGKSGIEKFPRCSPLLPARKERERDRPDQSLYFRHRLRARRERERERFTDRPSEVAEREKRRSKS
jgi:hypothetical protein